VLARNTTPDGRVAHCELSIQGGRLLLHDDFGGGTPLVHGGTAVALHAYVEDVDAVYARAVAAGASGVEPPEDAFWGDRHAQFDDPAGHRWSIATPRERPAEDGTDDEAR
jgi:PhnB protein